MIHLSRWKVILLVLSLAFGVLFAYPNLLSPAQREALPGWLPKNTLNLGLDLQGGSYLLLEVDVDEMRAKRIVNTTEDARLTLREARIATSGFVPDDRGVVVSIADPSQMDAALTALRVLAQPDSTGAAERQVSRLSGNRIRLAFTDQAINGMGATAVDQSIEVVRRRIDSLGTREPS
ncbi:MAG: protein translocase subunit SecD, partial [Brevundimonas sp.]|nr:protein translocase subunit SecD [Brevundimonas sp.]